jgi:hypothetical protein
MWAWLGRGSFFAGAAGAAAAAAAGDNAHQNAKSDNAHQRAWMQKQDSKRNGEMTAPLLQSDHGIDADVDAEIRVWGEDDAAELGFERPGKTLRGGFEKCYNKLSVAVSEEVDLLAAKHASSRDGLPATVCSKAAATQHQQQQLYGDSEEAEDDFLVVLCGENSAISIVSNGGCSSSCGSSSSSSSPSGKSEILGASEDE